jgi:NAD-dependent histone deacetylase SIR2
MECVKTGVVAICERCQGYAKPDVVFFGENLPATFFNKAL